MSGSKAKFYRKMVKKEKKKLVAEFIDEIKGCSIFQRLQIAWYIVRGKK